MVHILALAALILSASGTAFAQQGQAPAVTQFKVRIEKVSNPSSVEAPGVGRQGVGRQGVGRQGVGRQGVGLSPGVWCVHLPGEPIFSAGQLDRGQGLMMQAEDGNPGPLAKSLVMDLGRAMQATDGAAPASILLSSGVFMVPVGKTAPGPLRIGNAYE
jgi:hypothetical protein